MSEEIIMENAKEFSLPVPWGHIAAKAWGNPTYFPVLCVHGLLDNAGAFDRLITQLPKNYYYVSIDLPGHGFSSHFPSGMPLQFFNYILSIRYVVEELKWNIFKYIGHSLGSQLGTFYSVLYPEQIQSLVLIEGFIPQGVRNRDIIPRLKKLLDSTFEVSPSAQTTFNLYSRDDIMHMLKYKRVNCLNTEAAEAIFERSVIQVGELFKLSRDVRLKNYTPPMLNVSQLWTSILGNLSVEILFIFTTSSYNILTQNRNPQITQELENLIQNFNNITLIKVIGNHDIHNNNPERLSYEISKFLNKKNISSKL